MHTMDELKDVLAAAGLQLVSTEAAKHSATLARMAAEPAPPRVVRERPSLPPLDSGPLIQVETTRGEGARTGA